MAKIYETVCDQCKKVIGKGETEIKAPIRMKKSGGLSGALDSLIGKDKEKILSFCSKDCFLGYLDKAGLGTYTFTINGG